MIDLICDLVTEYGAMGAHIATPRFLVISLATKPMRRTFMSRCSLEKLNSPDKLRRTISPSRRETGLSPISRKRA